MRPEILERWQAWNDPFEGTVYTFYNDVKGLTTIGVGDLCNTVGEAMALDMVRDDGVSASPSEIAQEWHRVHDDPAFAKAGWIAAARGATCRLTKAGVAKLVAGKLAQMDAYLAKRFPEWEEWPWQAQMAVLSMSWACGPAFHFPHFEMALRTQDWGMAAAECHMDETGNPGLKPRNAANVELFKSAAIAAAAPQPEAASETGVSDTLEGPNT